MESFHFTKNKSEKLAECDNPSDSNINPDFLLNLKSTQLCLRLNLLPTATVGHVTATTVT